MSEIGAATEAVYTIGNRTFRSTRLNPQEQIHCLRRILPMVKAAGPILKLVAASGGVSGLQATLSAGSPEAKDAAGSDAGASGVDAFAAMGPLADVLAAMSDADVDYVVARCMAKTHMQREGQTLWAAVWSASGGGSMFSHLRMNHYLRICFETLKLSLADAFPDLIASLEDIAVKRTGSAKAA